MLRHFLACLQALLDRRLRTRQPLFLSVLLTVPCRDLRERPHHRSSRFCASALPACSSSPSFSCCAPPPPVLLYWPLHDMLLLRPLPLCAGCCHAGATCANFAAIGRLQTAGACDWATIRALDETLQGTWFKFPTEPELVVTSIGSRPGDSLSDLVFSLLFAKVLGRIRCELRARPCHYCTVAP